MALSAFVEGLLSGLDSTGQSTRKSPTAGVGRTRLLNGMHFNFIGRCLSGPIPIRADQDRFLLSSSDLRFANGEWVAPPRPAAPSVAPPPVASNCRWCSLSWQYRHSNSQLLPSGGLL